ncbi:MAG: cytochrome c biogenesis protein CcsA [Bacteroidia bacterium]|nr:cytochrome c biogenesis protein CcsA [Bacteroidia bacterium]
MDLLTGGKLGELFTSAAFAGALVAAWSFFLAERSEGEDKKSWEKLGKGGFLVHAGSIFGIIATLFYLIYAHRYEYHYVWSHSSNELPVYYMISCFWEGQEGSFLLWCFWHSILGSILVFNRSPWRNLVVAVIASIEMVISSMLLGVYITDSWVTGIFLLSGLLCGGYLAYKYIFHREKLPFAGLFHLVSVFMTLAFSVLLIRGQLGVGVKYIFWGTWGSWDDLAFGIFGKIILGYLVFLGVYLLRVARQENIPIGEIAAAVVLGGMVFVGMGTEPDFWKLGSTPFTTLKSVFPNNPVYAQNPNFIPSNGNGLNPLLQNYWMVIHPPTLFLGFASTVVPFSFVIAGLIKKQYSEWIRPALPWMAFSMMILGVGIIMGGYWAYETLNFGGYWNWDPVENSSLVPWLCGVAGLHAMLIYRKSKSYLKLSMLLIISTFLLVLYSTFLTRSGILGETSVHTFTDLGLSGQLLVLVMTYVVFVIVLMMLRWREIPERADESKVWSAEFMLFVGMLIFVFSGLVIIITTSLPVFNQIFGTNLAPPPNVQLFYYQWTVWFAILFGAVSGVGQFLWWKIMAKNSVSEALFRPFVLTLITASLVLLATFFTEMNFTYDKTFQEMVSPETLEMKSAIGKLFAWLKFGILSVSNELLLFSSVFGVMANADVLISLLRKNRKGLKVMGGTIVHLGFALMLLGMLFSSGYDEVISKNLRPEDLASFPEQEKNDNIAIDRRDPNYLKGFQVRYLGQKTAQTPVENLRILEETATRFKLSFEDADGETFAVVLDRVPFIVEEDRHLLDVHEISDNADPFAKPVGRIDLKMLEELLNQNIAGFEPKLINNRTLYGLEFSALDNPEKQFVLYPEAEINEDMGSILAHPGRKVFWNRDIYVFTSSLPTPESIEPKLYSFGMQIGDTVAIGDTKMMLAELRNLTSRPDLQKYDVAAAAHLIAFSARDTFIANPLYVIEGNRPGMITSQIEELGMDIAFVGITPDKDIVHIQVRQIDPRSDFVVIKAISKPFINLLWLGTFILVIGFGISIYRRVVESRSKT